MMKATLCAILACLLLTGCADQQPESTETVPVVTEAPAEPAGSYEPGSALELATGGAVREYPQNLGEIWAVRTMGEDVLVFSGYSSTILTRLTGENLYPVAEKKLDIFISADAPSLRITEDRVIYYDYSNRELVWLDESLQEISRLAMPEDIQGDPLLTRDQSKFYYCTHEGLRTMDLTTGISRLVKEMWFPNQFAEDLLMEDSIVRVAVMDEEGWMETLFLDAETGAMQGGMPDDVVLTSGGDWFYAFWPEGVLTQMIFGNEREVFQLHPRDYRDSGFFLPESHSAVVSHREGENLTLEYYDLSTGRLVSALELRDHHPSSFVETESGMLYFLTYREESYPVICRWDVTALPTGDADSYVGDWYTMDAPDEAGLEECRQYAKRLGQQHGLEIRIGLDAVEVRPSDYDPVPEYQVPVIWDALVQLEEMLANYPAGFFETALSDLEDSSLTICLVRTLWGNPQSGSLTEAAGIQYWVDNHSYVALTLGETFRSSFYHEMYHALEPRLLSNSKACYRWDELNPKGFEYDYDYVANQNRDGSAYLEESTRSFIDTYSMSFPKEDRARVMEYACMAGNEHYFISSAMQNKLRTLCEGFREAYGLEDYGQPLLWEQYLENPITK